jgi:hypothetical protein
MNCQFQHAGCSGSLPETVGVADHYSKLRDARHLGYDRCWGGNVVQQTERHDHIEAVVVEWEVFAASFVYDGPKHLSLLAESADRFNALNPQVGTPLS